MSDDPNRSAPSDEQVGKKKTRPSRIGRAIDIILLLVIGYCVWGFFFDDKVLEAAVDPVDGGKAAWDAFIDEGGLNSDSRFHGLRIKKASVSFTGDGRIGDVSMVLDKGASAKDLRSALAEVCDIEDSAWKVRTAPVLGGMADGDRCWGLYVEKNANQWSLSYRAKVPGAQPPGGSHP